MIEISVYVASQIAAPAWECPKCKNWDTSYGGMHEYCWHCNYRYVANVDALVESLQERVTYHRNGRTSLTIPWRELDADNKGGGG